MKPLVAASVVFLLACGGPGKPKTPKTPAAPFATGPLAGIVSLTEITSDGDQRPVSSRGIVEVDINSRIAIHVDVDHIKKLFYDRAGIDPKKVEELTQRLRDLDAITEIQKETLEQLTNLEKQLSTVGEKAFVHASDSEAALRGLGQLEKKLTQKIGAYATRHNIDPDVFFASEGNDVGDRLKLIDDERRVALQESRALAEKTKDLRWRMQAQLTSDGKSAPIHLDNYDNYPDGTFSFVDKLSPQVTPTELAAQTAEANRLANKLEDIQGLRAALLDALRSGLEQLVSSLNQAVLDDEQQLKDAIQKIAGDALKLNEVKQLKSDIVTIHDAAIEIRSACAPIIDAVKRSAIKSVSLSDGKKCVEAALKKAPAIADAAKDGTTQIEALSKQAGQSPSPLGKLLDPVKAVLNDSAVVTEVSARIENAKTTWNTISEFLGFASGPASAPVWTDDHQTDRVLAEITDTTIDLTRTARKDGDNVHFRPSLLDGDTSVLVGETSVFRVRRMGTYLDVSAGVLFLDKKDEHWGPYKAAPAVVAALHHTWRPETCGSGFLNAARPGIGLHFTYPRFQSDATFELGVGGSVLLFGDLIQAGVGYDLQAQVSYWYVGFGLDTLAKLGVRFSL